MVNSRQPQILEGELLTKEQKSYLLKQKMQMSNLMEQTAVAYGSDDNAPKPSGAEHKSENDLFSIKAGNRKELTVEKG